MIEIEKIDRMCIISLLAEGNDTYNIVKNYKLSEDLILECIDLLDKEVVMEAFDLSENFLLKAMESDYIKLADLKRLTMKTYSNLSNNFLSKYKSDINWNKMIIYLSTQIDSFDDYLDIIDENNLWDLISANDLPIEFIRKWKDKLNWKYLSIIKNFSDEEKLEFDEHIIKYDSTKELVDFTIPTISEIEILMKDYSDEKYIMTKKRNEKISELNNLIVSEVNDDKLNLLVKEIVEMNLNIKNA